MAAPTTAMPIDATAQAGVVAYLNSAQSLYGTSYNIRSQLMQRDQAYYREGDLSTEELRAKAANQTGDKKKLRNVTVPVVMPQVESQLAALVDTFLTGYPIFATVAPPGNEEALASFDAALSDNSTRFGWVAQLMQVLRDGLKYDLGAVEVSWEKVNIFSITTPELSNLSEGSKTEELYQGNKLLRLDPYNLILDTRVSPERNHIEGEYAGYTECISRINMKMRMDNLAKVNNKVTMNFKAAFESGSATVSNGAQDAGYFIPTINPDALLPVGQRTEHDWMQWSGLAANKNNNTIAYHNSYEWTVLYARIMPSDFGMRVPNASTVQIWKFIVVNRNTVIYAERQTNAHNLLPIIVCKPSNDGMAWQSKSFAENSTPYQDIASALMNSALASQRRKVYDRILYDPTRVRKQDIENTDPVARIPVKNAQFGKGFEGAVQPIPYDDKGVMEPIQMSQQIVQMAEVAVGQNRVQQGQFQKGNKTRTEFTTTMSNASSRQVMGSIGLEATFFWPMKEIIKSNMLQYQPPATLVAPNGNKVEVDPSKLRGAMVTFQLSDGLMSSEKLASLDVAGTVIQAATQIPLVNQEYDVMGIIEHTWDLQGIHWIRDYKRDANGQAHYLNQLAQNTQASGDMPPPPPQVPGQQQPPATAPGSALGNSLPTPSQSLAPTAGPLQ